jgi:hypothetical protein
VRSRATVRLARIHPTETMVARATGQIGRSTGTGATDVVEDVVEQEPAVL